MKEIARRDSQDESSKQMKEERNPLRDPSGITMMKRMNSDLPGSSKSTTAAEQRSCKESQQQTGNLSYVSLLRDR